MDERELRAINNPVQIETRADGKEYITGRAIVFNQWSQVLYGWFQERISRGALDNCDMTDVVAKFNHDPNFTLARTPDTLTLEIRDDGLWYSFEYDPTDPDHVRVRAKILRGDLRGSSFEFTTAKGGATWTMSEGEGGYEKRDVTAIDKLYDVAPVINPAYLQTSAGMSKRSKDAIRAEYDEFVSERGMGKKEKTFDEQFLIDMIAHHQMALDMAQQAINEAEHTEVKELAQSILDTQKSEIDTMQGYLDDWYPSKGKRGQSQAEQSAFWRIEAEIREREMAM